MNIIHNLVINNDDNNSRNEEEELITDGNEKKKKVPLLVHLGIPLIPSVLQCIVHELSFLSNAYPKMNILRYTNFRGIETHLVKIPVCSNEMSFMRVNQMYGFIDKLPSLIRGGNNNINLEEVSGWIIKRLGGLYETSFKNVGFELGYSMGSTVMDMDTAVAMWDEANVNTRSQRTILRYFKATFGKKVVVPAHNHAKYEMESRNVGNYVSVDPISSKTTIDGEFIHYWTKPLSKTLSASIATRLYSNEDDEEDDKKGIDNIDLVLGGDHGARKFRMLFKVICRNNKMEAVDDFKIKVAHIDCKKDTYNIIRETISPALNEELIELMGENKKLIVYRKKVDGKYKYTTQISTYSLNNNNPPPVFICPMTGEPVPDMEFVRACGIRVVVTGDLAFYASLLGKVNASGHWCTWCQLMYTDWKKKNHDAGESWSLRQMDELRESIFNKEVKDIPSNRKGVSDVALLHLIDIFAYIYPILHAEIGLGNYLLNRFFHWIDYRIERVSEEERQMRRDLSKVMEEVLDELKSKWDAFCIDEGIELVELNEEISNLKEAMNYRDEATNKFVHSVEERKELKQMIQELQGRIKPLMKLKKERKDDYDLKKKIMTTMNTQVELSISK